VRGFLIDFIADMLRNCLLNATFSGSPSKQVFICSSNLPDLHRYVPSCMNIGLSNDLTQFGKNKINAIRDGFIVCHDSFMQMEKPDIASSLDFRSIDM
jgi:hypothetical protein